MSYTSNLTFNTRQQLKKRLDDFCTFSWGPEFFDENSTQNAFDTFGVFIVGGKDALKFNNGPGFSNKYTTSQFQSANSILSGVEFKTQTISFTMGVYWFTIEEYRKLLLWLHPYEINDLGFSFAPGWRYTAKLSKLDDSTRYILGKDENGEYRYYTEIKLSFEVQGEPCLKYATNYSFNTDNLKNITFNTALDYIDSDLDTPVEIQLTLKPTGVEVAGPYSIRLEAKIPLSDVSYSNIMLFEGAFNNLSFTSTGGNKLRLRYLSDVGLLLHRIGDSTESLVTLQSTSYSGERIVESLQTNKFKLPGVLESNISSDRFSNIVFSLDCSNSWEVESINIKATARTNVI